MARLTFLPFPSRAGFYIGILPVLGLELNLIKIKERLAKRGTPPKTLTKRGTELFADGDVHVLRQIDSKSKYAANVCRAPWAPPKHPEFFSFFLDCIAGERE